MAIRQNSGDLYAMKKAIGAILWHCTNFTNETFRHRFCWCKWQVDKFCGTSKYKKRVSIPKWIHNFLKPIFTDLSKDSLLSKCLHGKTQNANEALNQIIWQKCQKNVFVSRHVLEMCINSAIIQFNDRASGVIKVLHYFNINPDGVRTFAPETIAPCG